MEPHYKCDHCNTKVHAYQVKNVNNRMWGCRDCYNKSDLRKNRLKSTRDWKRNNKERIRHIYLKWKLGVTKEQHNKMVEEHLNGCAVCKKPCQTGRELAVDHNHKTGQIRGLLCYKCNLALGYLNEDEDLIWNMLEYLKKHNIKIA